MIVFCLKAIHRLLSTASVLRASHTCYTQKLYGVYLTNLTENEQHLFMKTLYTTPQCLVLCDAFQKDITLANASAESRVQ